MPRAITTLPSPRVARRSGAAQPCAAHQRPLACDAGDPCRCSVGCRSMRGMGIGQAHCRRARACDCWCEPASGRRQQPQHVGDRGWQPLNGPRRASRRDHCLLRRHHRAPGPSARSSPAGPRAVLARTRRPADGREPGAGAIGPALAPGAVDAGAGRSASLAAAFRARPSGRPVASAGPAAPSRRCWPRGRRADPVACAIGLQQLLRAPIGLEQRAPRVAPAVGVRGRRERSTAASRLWSGQVKRQRRVVAAPQAPVYGGEGGRIGLPHSICGTGAPGSWNRWPGRRACGRGRARGCAARPSWRQAVTQAGAGRCEGIHHRRVRRQAGLHRELPGQQPSDGLGHRPAMQRRARRETGRGAQHQGAARGARPPSRVGGLRVARARRPVARHGLQPGGVHARPTGGGPSASPPRRAAGGSPAPVGGADSPARSRGPAPLRLAFEQAQEPGRHAACPSSTDRDRRERLAGSTSSPSAVARGARPRRRPNRRSGRHARRWGIVRNAAARPPPHEQQQQARRHGQQAPEIQRPSRVPPCSHAGAVTLAVTLTDGRGRAALRCRMDNTGMSYLSPTVAPRRTDPAGRSQAPSTTLAWPTCAAGCSAMWPARHRRAMAWPATRSCGSRRIPCLRRNSADIARLSFGFVAGPGKFETTLTRPDLFGDYYLEQFTLLLQNHQVELEVGVSHQPIPVHFSFAEHDHIEGTLSAERRQRMRDMFDLPDLAAMDDGIANGTFEPGPASRSRWRFSPRRAWTTSLHRLRHYTGTAPDYFQNFVLFTNYQFYIDEFVRLGRAAMMRGPVERLHRVRRARQHVTRRVGLPPSRATSTAEPPRLPQMPAYHPPAPTAPASRWSTSASARPTPRPSPTTSRCCARMPGSCWAIAPGCATRSIWRLRAGARLCARGPCARRGAAAVGADPRAGRDPGGAGAGGGRCHEDEGPSSSASCAPAPWPAPTTATGAAARQRPAAALQPEPGGGAGHGKRHHRRQRFPLPLPYGTLLCVSDKPLHGEIKLPGMADHFYRERGRPAPAHRHAQRSSCCASRAWTSCTAASCAALRKSPSSDRRRAGARHRTPEVLGWSSARSCATPAISVRRRHRRRRPVLHDRPGECLGVIGRTAPARPPPSACAWARARRTPAPVCAGRTTRRRALSMPPDAMAIKARWRGRPDGHAGPDFTCAENLLVYGRYFGMRDARIRARIRNCWSSPR